MSTENLLNNWQTYLEQQGKSNLTVNAYLRGLRYFITWNRKSFETTFNPAEIIPRDIKDWQAHQQTVEQNAPATINQRLVAASRFFQWAVANDLVRKDPTVGIHNLRPPQRRPKGLSHANLRKLLRAVHGEDNV